MYRAAWFGLGGFTCSVWGLMAVEGMAAQPVASVRSMTGELQAGMPFLFFAAALYFGIRAISALVSR